jgi:hypothetical protein
MATETTRKLPVEDYADKEKETKVKDPILEVRRIVKRAQALEKPEQRYLLEILRAMVGGEG